MLSLAFIRKADAGGLLPEHKSNLFYKFGGNK